MSCLSPSEFRLPDRLKLATFAVGEAALSSVLMIDDRRFPWLLLVPRLNEVEEFDDLSQQHRHKLVDEIAAATSGLKREFDACRINVADIGNRVGHLHVHVVARQQNDAFWPSVVWSRSRETYPSPDAAEPMRRRLCRACAELPAFVEVDVPLL